MAENKKYRVTYSIISHKDGVTADKLGQAHLEKLKKEDVGATDAVIMISMAYPADGSFSMLPASLDGRTGKEVDDNELFKVWTMLAKSLADSPTLGPGKKAFAAQVFEEIRSVMLVIRAGEAPKKNG
jgi:hypothetical protein